MSPRCRSSPRRSSRSRAPAPRSTPACSEIVRDGLSVYRVDGDALKALAPDVIVTQDHCEVCAVSLSDVEAATCTWTGHAGRHRLPQARLHGRRLRRHPPRRRARSASARPATRLVADMQRRIDAVSARVAGRPRPRVAFIEWVEPLMAGGNWMPELIEAAGGDNLFGAAGKHSDWMQWDELVAADPDVIVVAPCGYGLEPLPRGAAAAAGQARLGRSRRPCAQAASTSPTATPTSTAPARASPTAPRCSPRCCTPRSCRHASQGHRPGCASGA